MTTFVKFRNPRTGDIQSVKVGFSWTLLLFSAFFGIPLFLRKLNVLGGLMVALVIVNLIAASSSDPDMAAVYGLVQIAALIAYVVLGFIGNRLTAKNYLDNGWEWAEPEDEETRLAQGKWGLV